ncbi:BTAD domain-containing putative transcriptional regulator [Microtetraspora malaysiensis]|uniref:AfsR/SARP family transcriptional regulator n=1 Tax=Microtetraspora malaysiensis TaxID=161358 RepID=UPI003D8C852D
MDFGVLGPVTVQGHPISSGKQMIMLASLLCHANEPVTGDALADAAWPLAPPSPSTFRWHLHRLRGLVGERLIRRGDSYLLAVEDGELDTARFEELVRLAGAEPPERALPLLDSAMALWRGEPYDGLLDLAVIRAEAARLTEARLLAVEARARVLMALGRPAECVSDLAAAVSAHPLRESLIELRLRALAATGRRAEALRMFDQTRRRLRDELGVDPSGTLRRLHEDLLHHDPAPRLLPPDIHAFTGRTAELAVLDGLLDHPCGVAVISGVGGVGKSGLALHWAHRSRDRFPDGQLYANLGEHTPAEVLSRFLFALGAAVVPVEQHDQIALYREMLAHRRVLVILDNAPDSARAKPLLPGAPGCVTVVTGRSRFESLVADVGALPLRLDEMPLADAALLLSRIARIEVSRAAPLAELCAQLPLALRVAGARLLTRPGWGVETLTARLTGEHRLDEFRAGELDVRATLEAGYDDLPPAERTLFERLGLLRVPTFTAWMGAALLEVPVTIAGDLLERLAERQLLQPDGIDGAGQERYRCHDLIRLLARERAGTGPGQDAIVRRFLSCLLWLSKEAYLREYRGRFRLIESDSPLWQPSGEVLPADPMSWMAAERATLLAAIRQAADLGQANLSWGLALAAVRLYEIHGHFLDWVQSSQVALQSCRDNGDDRGAAVMIMSLGSVAVFQKHHAQAVTLLTEALPSLDDDAFRALALGNLAVAELALGQAEAAIAHLAEAAELARAAGDEVIEAVALARLAFHHDDPRPLLDRAGDLAAGHRRVSLMVLLCDLRVTLRTRCHVHADVLSNRLLTEVRLYGDRVLEREALCLRADSLTALGRAGEAAACLRRAHELALAQHALPEARRIAGLLGR